MSYLTGLHLFELRLSLLDLLLEVTNFYDGAHDVKEGRKQPEDVVNIVTVIQEGIAELPETDRVEVQRVVREKVQDEGEIA